VFRIAHLLGAPASILVEFLVKLKTN